MTAPPRPSIDNLQRFMLGALTRAEAEQAVAWVERSPDAPRALAGVAAHDALTKAVTSTVGVTAPPAQVVDRVVENVTASFRAPPPLPDVAQQTRPSPAGQELLGSTADWATPSGTAPARLGPFRVVRELGSGGMGVVYEAFDEKLGRRAAVKVLGAKFATDADARLRFLREGRAVADLKSDHVVTIYQVGEEAGAPFLAMELIDGTTLEGWLATKPAAVTAKEVLWVARDVLTGLAAAHKKGRIHRDIKPANAMIERDTGRVKILDFGLTRGTDGSDQMTRSGAVIGTPAYMSPEQARGEELDARTDLFSAGVVLYRMVFGKSPFKRDTEFNTLVAVAQEPPPALKGLPPELSAFVARLMSPKREGRPADAGAALAELKALEARLNAPAHVSVPPVVPSRPAEHRPRRQFQIGCVVTIALCLFVAPVVIIVRDKNGKEVARLEVPDDKVKGGKVEVIDPKTDAKTVVPLPPNKGEPTKDPGKADPRGPKEPPPLGVRSRVTVTSYTAGYEDHTTDAKRLFIERGTKATITEFPNDKTRCRVRLDNAAKDEVWVLRDCLAAE